MQSVQPLQTVYSGSTDSADKTVLAIVHCVPGYQRCHQPNFLWMEFILPRYVSYKEASSHAFHTNELLIVASHPAWNEIFMLENVKMAVSCMIAPFNVILHMCEHGPSLIWEKYRKNTRKKVTVVLNFPGTRKKHST